MAPVVCRTCGQPMRLLDDEEQRWYCFKDDEVYWGNKNTWDERPKAAAKSTTHLSGPPTNSFQPTQPQIVREIIKEKETVREIVKIRCRHCGGLFEEKESRCPNCGAPA